MTSAFCVFFKNSLPTPWIYSPLLSSVSFIILSSFRYKIHLNLIFAHDMKHHFHFFPHGYAIEPFYLIKWLFFSLATAVSTLPYIASPYIGRSISGILTIKPIVFQKIQRCHSSYNFLVNIKICQCNLPTFVPQYCLDCS